jgi:hypothetical protein
MGASDPFATYRARYGGQLVERALDRLSAGEVSSTSYGWRVTSRPDLGDDPRYRAYWPKRSDRSRSGWRCRCWHGRSNRMCSHILAVVLIRAGLASRAVSHVDEGEAS